MYRVAVHQAQPGAILGASLFDRDGRLLADAGLTLTTRTQRQIANHGYLRVLITDGGPPGPEFIPPHVRAGILAALRSSVTFLRDAWDPNPRRPRKGLGAAWPLDLALRRAVSDLIEHSAGDRGFPAPGPVRPGPLQWFDDAVDAAAVAVAVADAFQLDSPTLHRLAHGMVLRDIGMLVLPRELRESDGPLTPVQIAQVREHPLRAYELLKKLDWADETSRLIVRQHHERHDGSGYPDGLVGLPAVHRTRREQLDESLTLLVSDIAAAADVFNALMVDRVHRPPRPTGVIKQMLRAMAGSKLNAAVVDAIIDRWVPPTELSPGQLRPAS